MEYNKRIFTIGEFTETTLLAFAHMADMMGARKKGLVSKALQNHIMLAVTEVNGCAICAYAHTKDALEMGMPQEDIEKLLSGTVEHMDADEAVALFFAQHYAETKGEFTEKAWQRVIDTYGEQKARGILAVTRAIMFGNAYGIASGALFYRIKRKPVSNSRLGQELAITFLGLVLIPFAMIRGLFVKPS